jgi:hypothetical protein
MNTQQLRPLGEAEAVSVPDREIIVRPDDRVWFDVVPGESATIRVHSGMVGGRYAIMEHRIARPAAQPLHSQVDDDVFEVFDAVVTFLFSDDKFEGASGTIVVISASAAHTWANLSGKPAQMRTMVTPGGIENLFSILAGLRPTEAVALAETFGSKILSPGLFA